MINAFFLIGIWETQFTYSIELGRIIIKNVYDFYSFIFSKLAHTDRKFPIFLRRSFRLKTTKKNEKRKDNFFKISFFKNGRF